MLVAALQAEVAAPAFEVQEDDDEGHRLVVPWFECYMSSSAMRAW